MDTPPPPPRVSPDGRFYYDGREWKPLPGPSQVPAPVAGAQPYTSPRRESGSRAPEGLAWVLALLPLVWGFSTLFGETFGFVASFGVCVLAAVIVAFDRRDLGRHGIAVRGPAVGVAILYVVFMPMYLYSRAKTAGTTLATFGAWFAAMVLSVVLPIVVHLILLAGGADDDEGQGKPAEMTCGVLAADAVRISDRGTEMVRLLDVRNPGIIEDNRDTFDTPSGDAESLVLSCRGTGVWSDGSTGPVIVNASVDAKGQYWVFYEPEEVKEP